MWLFASARVDVNIRCWFEFRDHSQGKRAIAGDFLAATDLGSQLPRIALFKQEQRQVFRTARRQGPGELPVHRPSERVHLRRIKSQHIKPRSNTIHPMDEQNEVNRRLPGQNVPRQVLAGHTRKALNRDIQDMQDMIQRVLHQKKGQYQR